MDCLLFNDPHFYSLKSISKLIWDYQNFQNHFGITKIFWNQFHIPNEILKFSKWVNYIIRSLLTPSNMSRGVILLSKLPFWSRLVDPNILSTTWNYFVNFLISFWIRNEFWKSFGIWKLFQKCFVIWIQFWNCFQTLWPALL